MIYTAHWYACDRCGELYRPPEKRVCLLRQMQLAAEAGWEILAGKATCPECQHKKTKESVR